jgi:Family of unknown function (DUF6282)
VTTEITIDNDHDRLEIRRHSVCHGVDWLFSDRRSILKGAVDTHVHSGPSIVPRALDHLQLTQACSNAGFAAVDTKDHDYAGVTTAQRITASFPELTTRAFSGIALSNIGGGMPPPTRSSIRRRWAAKSFGCQH